MATTYVVHFQPTFHAGLAVEIVDDLDATLIALHRRDPQPLSGSALDAFRAAIRASRPLELGDAMEGARDGIVVDVRVSDGSSTHELKAWCPTRDENPRHVWFLCAILEAARHAYGSDAEATRAIADVTTYFRT